MPPTGFFQELKRRRVVRVAIAYAVAALAVVQGADLILPPLHLPAWLLTAVVAIALIGFVPAVILAWAFDWTGEGIRRTEPAGLGAVRAAAPRQAGRGLDVVIGTGAGILVGVCVGLLAGTVLHRVTPGAVPAGVGAGALAGAAACVLVALALTGGWWSRVRRRRAQAAGAPEADARGGRRLGAGIGFTLGIVVTLSAAFALAPRAGRNPSGLPAGTPLKTYARTAKRKVAVTRFANLTGDPALEPVGRLAEDWVTRRLRSIAEAEVVAVAPAVAADTSEDAVDALRRRTGADVVLFGSYYREGTDVLLDARLVAPRGSWIPSGIAGLSIGPVRTAGDRLVTGAEQLASRVAGAVAAACALPECLPGRRPPLYEAREVWWEGWLAELGGDPETARRSWRRAIALDSTFVNPYLHLAELSSCAQKDSIGDILEARRLEFGESDMLYMRAQRADCHGDLEAAYQYRRRGEALAPDVEGAREGPAYAALVSGRLHEAEQRFRDLIRSNPRRSGFHHNLGSALHLQGRIAEEQRAADEGRRQVSDPVERHVLGLEALAAQGRVADLDARFDEGRRAGLSLFALASEYEAVAEELEWHGHAAHARAFSQRTLDELERAPSAEQTSPEHVAVRVRALGLLGRWREARALLDRAGRRDRLSVAFRGMSAAAAGDRAAARIALDDLERLPPGEFLGYPPREVCLAGILSTLGEKDEALRVLADGQARRTVPRSAPAWAHNRFLLRALQHDPRFERMFAPID